MKNLFFYGTLRHLPLLEIVLGRTATSLDVSPARLPDYLVSAAAEGPFPMIAGSPGDRAEGVLVCGLGPADIARLDYYEGSFAYDLVQVRLAGGQQAEVYLPQQGRWTPDGPWRLSDWQDNWAALSCHAAQEVMGYFGEKTRDEVGGMFPMIRKRAGSQVHAVNSLHGAGTLQGRVDILARQRRYAQFFALDEIQLSHERFDGTMTDPLARAVFVAADAAIVLPYDPLLDRVLLVEQIRVGPLARGDRSVWQLEPIAGHIDPGETPQETAQREAAEEAGLTLHSLEKIAETYASPGNSTEFHYIFVGLAELSDTAQGSGGLDSEGEDIRSHIIGFEQLMEMVNRFEVVNAPLILAAHWLAHNRQRLRVKT